MRAMRLFVGLVLAVWFLLQAGLTPLLLAVVVISISFLVALPYALTHEPFVRSTCILAIVAIVGFLGVRLLKPFYEGYTIYSGPGSMAGEIRSITRALEDFKRDHRGNPPSPLGMWDILMRKSDSTELGDTPAKGTSCGPYPVFWKMNRLNGWSAVADKPATGIGWVYKVTGTDYTFSAVNAKGDAVLSDDEAHLYYFRPSERAYVASQRARNNWDGLFFATPLVVYWLAILVWRPSLRARHRAKGLCESCGYDLRAHVSGQKCPECGTLILPPEPPADPVWHEFRRRVVAIVVSRKLWRAVLANVGVVVIAACMVLIGNLFIRLHHEVAGSVCFMLLAFGVVPLGYVLRRLRGPLIACQNCHHDLRAHKPGDKCPECGTLIGPTVV